MVGACGGAVRAKILLWYARARIVLLALNIATTRSTNISSSSHSTGIFDSSFASGPLPPVLEITTSQ